MPHRQRCGEEPNTRDGTHPFDAAAARAYEALIAATAIANGLPLYTCNPDDYEGIPALDVRAVRHPDP